MTADEQYLSCPFPYDVLPGAVMVFAEGYGEKSMWFNEYGAKDCVATCFALGVQNGKEYASGHYITAYLGNRTNILHTTSTPDVSLDSGKLKIKSGLLCNRWSLRLQYTILTFGQQCSVPTSWDIVG